MTSDNNALLRELDHIDNMHHVDIRAWTRQRSQDTEKDPRPSDVKEGTYLSSSSAPFQYNITTPFELKHPNQTHLILYVITKEQKRPVSHSIVSDSEV